MESATAEQQLKTVKLLLDHGAEPDRNALAEEDGLMDYVLFHILNDPEDAAWKFRCRFFILLLSYGFTTPYVRQTMLAKIDNRHLDQYRFYRTPCENAPFRAVICGPHGFVFAYL